MSGGQVFEYEHVQDHACCATALFILATVNCMLAELGRANVPY